MLPDLVDMDVYEDAAFYDAEFAQRNHDADFFLQQSLKIGGPVLEVACGTGRITLPIAKHGIKIVGLDVTLPMLDVARRKAKDASLDIAWLHQDCRDIQVQDSFKLIFSATNAMQHLHDGLSINAFLQSAKRALRPGGTLILDVFNPNLHKLARASSTRYLHKTVSDEGGIPMRVEASSRYDSATQVLVFDLYYMREDKCIRTKKVSMRCFFPEELMALCAFNGLKVRHRYGDYDMSPFTSNSPKQILFCEADHL
ncbi:MAG: class I SAM-dependent methyltransferase [Aquabacterium sp.]